MPIRWGCWSRRWVRSRPSTPMRNRFTMRHPGGFRPTGSSQVDPFSALAGACAALYGPLHGGANEAVLRMLEEIGSIHNIPAYIKRVKAGEVRLMGFGHRVYKNFDPRGKVIKRLAEE